MSIFKSLPVLAIWGVNSNTLSGRSFCFKSDFYVQLCLEKASVFSSLCTAVCWFHMKFPKMPVTCLDVIVWGKKKVIIPFLITRCWIMNFVFFFFFFYAVSYKQWFSPYPFTELGLNVKDCCNCMTEILIIKLSLTA